VGHAPNGGGDGLIRKILVLMAVTLALGAVAAPAAHAQYVAGQPGFIIDPSEVPDTGGQVTITGFGCPPDEVVDAYLLAPDGEILIGSGVSSDDPDGSFQFVATIPPTPAGEYPVLVRCGAVTLSNTLRITSTAVPAAAPGAAQAATGTLPRTGGDAVPWLRIGFVLVAVGGLLALSARRRRRAYA
jgi:LPXTG-motif cell wall-anchored protein